MLQNYHVAGIVSVVFYGMCNVSYIMAEFWGIDCFVGHDGSRVQLNS